MSEENNKWKIYETEEYDGREVYNDPLYAEKLIFQTYYIENEDERKKKQVEILNAALSTAECKGGIRDMLDNISLNRESKFKQFAIACRIMDMLNDDVIDDETFANEMRQIHKLITHERKFICTIEPFHIDGEDLWKLGDF